MVLFSEYCFMIIGFVPLVVLYIAGSLHVESSAFRQEQQSVKKAIQRFEEADISGESILSEYRALCRSIEHSNSWQQAMLKWDKSAWKSELEKFPDIFNKSGICLDAVYVYPPPISGLDHYSHSFAGSGENDAKLVFFYKY